MKDDRSLFGERGMEGEASFSYLGESMPNHDCNECAGSINDVLLGIDGSKSGELEGINIEEMDGVQGGEEKKVDVKRRFKLLEAEMTGGDSDDEEPIGSLFKFKKLRNSKKLMPGSKEKIVIRVENPKAKDEGSYGALELEDTLASFRKKLKAPKMSKESSNVGKQSASKQVAEESRADVVPRPDRSLNGISKDRPLGKVKRTMSDVATHAGENTRSNNGSKSNRLTSQSSTDLLPATVRKSHSASLPKLTEESSVCGGEGFDLASGGSIEAPLKVHIRKPGRFSTVTKAEESSKGDGGFDQPSGGISKGLRSAVVRRTRSKRKQSEEMLGSNESLDQHSDGDMDDSLSSLLRKSHFVSIQKKEISQADGGLSQTSDGLPEYHIPVPIRKVRSVTWKQKEETLTLDHGLGRNSDELSKNSLPVSVRKVRSASILKDTEESLKSEDRVNQVINRPSNDLHSVPGRKSHNASTSKLTDECTRSNGYLNQTTDGVSEDSLSVLFRKSRSVSIQRRLKETPRSSDGLSQLSDEIQKDLPSNTVQKNWSDLIPVLVEEIPRSMDDGFSKNSGTPEDSMPTLVRRSSTDSTPHLSEETPNLKDYGLDRHSDGLPADSLAVVVETDNAVSIPNLTEAALVSGDGLSQVSVGAPKNSISSLVLGSSGSISELNQSYDGALEDFLFLQVRESSPVLNQKIPEETHKLESNANQNCDGMLEELKNGLSRSPENVSKDSSTLVLTTNGASDQIPDGASHFQNMGSDCVQKMTEESTRFDISKDQKFLSNLFLLQKQGTQSQFDDDRLDGSSGPVQNFGSTSFPKQSDDTSICDLLSSQFSDEISKDLPAEDPKLCTISRTNQIEEISISDDDKTSKESLSHAVQIFDSASIPNQIEEIPVSDDVFNQLPGGFSEDFQTVQAQKASISMRKEETHSHDDDGSNQCYDVAFGESESIPMQKSSPASTSMQTAESNISDGDLNCQLGGVLADLPIDVLQKSCFASTSNHTEANPRSNDGFSHQSDGVLTDLPGDLVQKSSFAFASDNTKENSRPDEGLNCRSDGVFTDLPLVVDRKSFYASTSNHEEEVPLISVVSNQSPSETLMDSLTLIQSTLSTSDGKPTEEILETDNSVDKVSNDPSPILVSDSCIGVEFKDIGGNSIILARRGICPNVVVRSPSPDKNDKNVGVTKRVTRNTKRRRHEDMAYEGDVDWDVQIHEKGFLENNVVSDGDRPTRAKAKNDLLSNLLAEAEDGGAAAAVATGLKAREPGPIEKIKFKEILKRRGGIQEYLECRNMVLDLWGKDVCRVLPLSDCGVSDAPSEDEPSRASLIREIYAFLDQSGYINVGIVSEKGRAKPDVMPQLKLSKDKKPKENCGGRVADSEEEVAFILGQVRSSEPATATHNDDDDDDEDEKPISVLISDAVGRNKPVSSGKVLDTSTLIESEEFEVAAMKLELEAPSVNLRDKVEDGCLGSMLALEKIKASIVNPLEDNDSLQCDSGVLQRIIVVGAGPAGLSAARHLQRQGFSVCVLEARDRIGGRVHTDRLSLSVPVDLGASIITGVEADVATERRPDPSSLLCTQLGLELTVLNSDCPLYDIVTRDKVPTDLDEALEAEYNSLLDDMAVLVDQKCERTMKMSLEEGFEFALQRRRMGCSTTVVSDFSNLDTSTDAVSYGRVLDDAFLNKEILSPLERRVMDWHFANLEYGCAAMLSMVSLPYWNQDDIYGGFGGAHCMIKGGYSTVVESLGKDLDIRLNHIVTEVTYSMRDLKENGDRKTRIKVSTENGKEFVGDAVLITVPLGCLKANTIKFSPVLPEWKQSSIKRLGFGVLNKVVLEFPVVFWDDAVDYFGATADETDRRGQCFMFWNVKKTVGAPVLIALVVGKAAIDGQILTDRAHVDHAMLVLRKLFGEALVPDPVAFVVTNWGQDQFSRGAYSYVAVGASGEDYDILGRPVNNCLFFAGEATCKEHPDTVGGAMMSGLREAVRIIDIMKTGTDYTAEVEAMEAAQRQSDNERNEVTEMVKRLAAGELSSVVSKSCLGGEQRVLSKEVLLQDMFLSAKTTAGRLHLVKELLQLPVTTLKSFMGTKEGLSTLNSWILDSMGKDGTQLLRHCVRLLMLVSTNLLAVRLSGIGRTIKEKVCVHTSRDIRAVASQLVSMWIEVFRKEKAANGGSKFLRQTATSEQSKIKAKDISSGKPPLRATNDATDSKGNLQLPSSVGSHSPSSANHKKAECKPVKLEIGAEANSSRSHSIIQDSKVEEDIIMSEEEAAAFAAAEAARVAALAAAEAYASTEAECSTVRELPKIPSFHKFARREQYAQREDLDPGRRKWPGGVLGKQDCISEIDSRNCRVRNWSVDFSATCGNLDGSRIMGDNYKQSSYSNEIACNLNAREHSGESGAVESRLVNPWFQSGGSFEGKEYSAIDRWQLHAEGVDIDLFDTSIHVTDEEDSTKISKEDKSLSENQPRGVEQIKQAVVDYVASLLMPLYKTRKIDKEGYKSILKKSATKVIDQSTEAEKALTVSEFLEFKRKNKIRSFVDKLIERHMALTPSSKR